MPHDARQAEDLVLIPDFEICPGRELGQRFEAFARQSGAPETFPGLSTMHPPDEGEIAILSDEISLARSARPNRDAIPCPVCSPRSPKWLDGGRLIWCGATRAIYLIGPTCGSTGWASRVTQALNAYLQEELVRKNAARLAAEVRLSAPRLAWIEANRAAIARVEALHQGLAETFPKLRHLIYRRAKGGDVIWEPIDDVSQAIGRVRGPRFLTSSWREAPKLGAAAETLAAIGRLCGDADPATWAAELAPAICELRLGELDEAIGTLKAAAQNVEEAAAFLSAETVQTLARLSRAWADGPNAFWIPNTLSGFDLKSGGKLWRGPLNEIRPLPPLPTPEPA